MDWMSENEDNGFYVMHFLTEGSANGKCENHHCAVPSQGQDHDPTMRSLGLWVHGCIQLHGFR